MTKRKRLACADTHNWLERFTEAELREGVTLRFVIQDVDAEDLGK